jgi:hypothetical protein
VVLPQQRLPILRCVLAARDPFFEDLAFDGRGSAAGG